MLIDEKTRSDSAVRDIVFILFECFFLDDPSLITGIGNSSTWA